MFERFSDRARRAVVAAQDEARMLGHNHIGSEHLLLGLLDVLDTGQAEVLTGAGITAEAARAQVEELAGPRNKLPSGLPITFTPRAKKVLELSLREALEQGRGYIGTEHILLAVMRDDDDLGAQVLRRLGGSPSALRQRVLEAATAATPETAEAPEAPEEPAGGPGGRPWNWKFAQGYRREAGSGPQRTVEMFRYTLTGIDQRLAAIERHLGISDVREAGEFRPLLTSVERHLTNIERHLGVPAEAPDQPAEPDGPTAAD